MQINISNTDLKALCTLIDKCTEIVQEKQPTLKEYNYARRLRLVKKAIIRKNRINISNN